MFFLKADELYNHLDSIIHQETQQHPTHYDLTVDYIHSFKQPGALDFGGSEFKASQKEIIEPKMNEGDKYGWWNLSEGLYQATMNEKIKESEDTIALIGLHVHARKAGIIGNTSMLTPQQSNNNITINFLVPESGCNIKENARLGVLYLLAN